MSGHGKVLCTRCSKLIRQCRCPEHRVTHRYELCEDCKAHPAPMPPVRGPIVCGGAR